MHPPVLPPKIMSPKSINIKIKAWLIITVIYKPYTEHKQLWNLNLKKHSGLNGIRPHDIHISFHMTFHIFIYILQFIRVYYELTMWPSPRWLDCSVGRALHRYRRGRGFEYRSSFNFFFQALISQLLNCDDQLCLHILLGSSNIWYFIYSFAVTIVLLLSGK